MDTLCLIEDCSNPRRARGWCTKHYQRWQRHGDPTADVIEKPADGEPLAYFYAHVNDETDDCIVWPYGATGNGYGVVYIDHVATHVHALACERHHGPRPAGLEVAHAPVICHNRRCFNPRHLTWATPSINNSSHKILDGTATLGEKNPLARLTATKVDEIRSRWAAGGRTTKRSLAVEFLVSEMTIGRIVNNQLWQQVDYEPVPRRLDGLTDDALAEIRLRYAAGGVTQRALAVEYGIAQAQVSRIIRGWIGGKPPLG